LQIAKQSRCPKSRLEVNYSAIRIPKSGIGMRLGNLQLSSPLLLAPMAGITDYPFRKLVRESECGLVFTEMASAEGLLRKGRALLRIGEDEHPVVVQLCGSTPNILADAAQMAVETGAGADLMRFPEKVRTILVAVRKGVNCPLTIKIRSGWDREHINAAEISKIAMDCGADGIILHPRTKVQGFGGRADWALITEVKRAVNIPVIGNGDVTTPFLADRMFKEVGCDGVMIGRGALGNPWIFQGQGVFPSLNDRRRMIARHFSLLREQYGEKGAMKRILRHVAWYTKGLPFSASLRASLPAMRIKERLFEAVDSYFERMA
jgi:tRNA-dihydrouridine synthase B